MKDTRCTMIDGFAYTNVTSQQNIHDGIIIKCKGKSDCESPIYDIPYHDINSYIDQINKRKVEKAIVILDNIEFLQQCKCLKHLHIIPSYQSKENFDFSYLYEMPEIQSLNCQTQYGERREHFGVIDYSKVTGLLDLCVEVTKGTINYNKVDTLRSLSISALKGSAKNLFDVFCSKQLKVLFVTQCGIQSLDGIEQSEKMKSLSLWYNRKLSDISALTKVKDTLKTLRIENCPKIKNFSVLELSRK